MDRYDHRKEVADAEFHGLREASVAYVLGLLAAIPQAWTRSPWTWMLVGVRGKDYPAMIYYQ